MTTNRSITRRSGLCPGSGARLSLKMPIKFANGTTIGPVTIICTTVLFLAVIACFVILSLFGHVDNVRGWITPLIPVLSIIGSTFLLWAKSHSVLASTTAASSTAAVNAAQARDAATHVEQVIGDVGTQVADNADKLNGQLEAKIAAAVSAALAQRDAALTAGAVVPAVTTTAKKTAARKRTAAKRTTTKGS